MSTLDCAILVVNKTLYYRRFVVITGTPSCAEPIPKSELSPLWWCLKPSFFSVAIHILISVMIIIRLSTRDALANLTNSVPLFIDQTDKSFRVLTKVVHVIVSIVCNARQLADAKGARAISVRWFIQMWSMIVFGRTRLTAQLLWHRVNNQRSWN